MNRYEQATGAGKGAPIVIRYAEIPIGSGPVPGCSHCGAARASVEPLPLAEVVSALGALGAASSKDRRPNIAFSGMEPFAHPELPALIAAARAIDCDRIMLTTDGRFLDQGGNALGAYAAGVTHVRLVLLAGDGETHDRLAGTKGAFDATRRGAAAWTAAGEDSLLTGTVPLCRHTLGHASAAIARLASLGATAVELDASTLRPRKDDHALLAAALETATVNRVAASVTGWADTLPVPYLMAPWLTVGSGA